MNTQYSNSEPLPWELLDTGEKLWEDFSAQAQEKIIRHYAPKIRFIALRLKAKIPRNIDMGELISAGTLGLLEALGKFRAQYGIKFETYAESRIKGAMIDELRRLDWFPRSFRQRLRILDEIMRSIEHDEGRIATEAELQERTGYDLKEVRECLEALQNQLWVSLESVQEFIAEDSPKDTSEPYSTAVAKELGERLAPLIDNLTNREKLVLSLYYADEMNMRETAEIMGITEGRVSQLHAQAIARLRRNFYNTYGETGDF